MCLIVVTQIRYLLTLRAFIIFTYLLAIPICFPAINYLKRVCYNAVLLRAHSCDTYTTPVTH